MQENGMQKITEFELYSELNNQCLLENQQVLFNQIPECVNKYYELLQSSDKTAHFFTSELVENHLQSALAAWMKASLSPKTAAELIELDKRHQKVGEVHARINIDMELVSQAMMVLKNTLYEGLVKQDPINTHLIRLAENILDYGLICINSAYFNNHDHISHESQILHNHLATMDFALEVQQMRTAIHRWFSMCIIENKVGCVLETDFALWIRHKLPLAILDKQSLEAIENILNQLEEDYAQQSFENSQQLNNAQKLINSLSWSLEELSKKLIQTSEKKDPLTKVYNRRFLDAILLQETMRAQRLQKNYSIVMLDLDEFKQVNDLHGHDMGDQVLVKTGEIINQYIRVSDFGFRFGGEEFLILLTECNANKAAFVSEKILNALRESVFYTNKEEELKVTASFGVAEFDGQPDYQHTIKKADEALYLSKQNGRNQVTIFAPS